MFSLKKVNNQIVKSIAYAPDDEDKEDKKPVLGSDLFPEIYSNIFICAKKKSGKTTLISHIIKHCVNSKTKVIIFSSTFYKDKSFIAIKNFCDKHNISIDGYTSLKDDDGNNILDQLIDSLKIGSQKDNKVKLSNYINLFEDSEDEDEKPKRYKYRSPEFLFVFDDLSRELQNKSINVFLKMNRHFKSKVIISTQYIHDLRPEALKQIDYFLLLRGHPDKKLQLFHEHADLNLDFDTFHNIYKDATKDKFGFLYIDTNNSLYRKNFDQEYKISEN